MAKALSRSISDTDGGVSLKFATDKYHIVVKPILGGLHHEYGFDRTAA